MEQKMQLYGFNNLTKALSLSLYEVFFAESEEVRKDYLRKTNECFSAEPLAGILRGVADRINAQVLNVSTQDYIPHGASVTVLIAEEPIISSGEIALAHLDKSHITVHTYPEWHPDSTIATFRADIDVSTCGVISPLDAIDFLLDIFAPEIATMDYRVRGFTRAADGKKLYMDHNITSIQDFISPELLARYDAADVNNAPCNLFHTRLLTREIDPQNACLRREMTEMWCGANLP